MDIIRITFTVVVASPPPKKKKKKKKKTHFHKSYLVGEVLVAVVLLIEKEKE